MIKNPPRINIKKSDYLCKFNQNWNFISNKLNIFNYNSHLFFYEWLDIEIKNKTIQGNWSGFLHNAIKQPKNEYKKKYADKIYDLESLVKNSYFLDKLETCKGLFVFTEHIKQYLITETKFEKIESLFHPIPDFVFNYRWKNINQVLHIGQQLRKYHTFLDLKTKYDKILINPINCPEDLEEMQLYSKNHVQIIKNIETYEYLNCLATSIVFLDLYDVAACNTSLECIATGTPIVIKKLAGCVEYLGDDYPLFFNNLDEAERKINDINLIYSGHKYLCELNKRKLKLGFFLHDFCNKFVKLTSK